MDFKEIYCSSNVEEKMAKNETISPDINLKVTFSLGFFVCVMIGEF